MSTKEYTGFTRHLQFGKFVDKEHIFETELELVDWLASPNPTNETRWSDFTRHTVQEGFHAVKIYKWENSQLLTDIVGFETLEEAQSHVAQFDDHQLAKIYSPTGELLYTTGTLA
jgi:hypothetical protein